MKVQNFWLKLRQWVEAMENTHDYPTVLQTEINELRERIKKLEGED